MNQELLRIVDSIARDKNIDKESIFADLEEAMVSAIRKHFGDTESEIAVQIDRSSGKVTAFKDGQADRHQGAGPHRRPDRQAGHDPEDPRGRARQHLQRVRPDGKASSSPGPWFATKAAR